jgi:hypothetical protein
VTPDGSAYVVAATDGRLHPYDLDSGELGEPFPDLAGNRHDPFAILAAAPDGRSLFQGAAIHRFGEPITTRLAVSTPAPECRVSHRAPSPAAWSTPPSTARARSWR